MFDMSRSAVATTSILTFNHLHDGQVVTLVGLKHIGHPEYYQQIQDRLANLTMAGAMVHYEGIRSPSNQALRSASRVDRLKIALADRTFTAPSRWGWLEEFGLVSQWKGLRFDHTWENHDATTLDLARRESLRSAFGRWAGTSLLNLFLSSVSDARMRETVLPSFISDAEANTDMPQQLENTRDGKVLISYRNEIALQDMDSYHASQPDAPIALLWGEGHLPGLGRGLSTRNYEMVHQERLVAIDTSRIQQQ
jgi:hypothetical protein